MVVGQDQKFLAAPACGSRTRYSWRLSLAAVIGLLPSRLFPDREVGQVNFGPPGHGLGMRQYARTRDVGCLPCIRIGFPVLHNCRKKFVGKVRVGSTMAASLHE